MKNILITGGGGFIGSNLIDSLLKKNPDLNITCLDNFDPFYDPDIKRRNIKSHLKNPNFKLVEEDIRNLDALKSKLDKNYDVIIHLAAKVGVRPSVLDPVVYTEVNIDGTQNILELTRLINCKKFIFASSSSIYGVNPNVPWSEKDSLVLPESPYASSKISGELLGHVYSNLFGIQFLGLRFFTVYGPRQRPDLAIHKFTKLILQGEPIDVYGDGSTKRDYTYVDDIVSGIISALDYTSSQYEIINLGNNQPVELSSLISQLEKILGKKAVINKLPNQPGDVPLTFADITKAQQLLNYQPKTSISEGISRFIEWFRAEGNSI